MSATEKTSEGTLQTSRIARATGLLAWSVFLSRVLGYIRDALVSHHYGANRLSDAYFQSFTIPDLLYFLIAGGALSSAFIPVFTQYLAEGKEEEAWKVFSVVATVMVPIVTLFVLLGEIFVYPLCRIIAPGFTPDQIQTLGYLTRIILPAQICFFLGGLLIATQNARGHFFGQAIGPLIYNLGIILGGLFLSGTAQIAGFSWGGLLGAITGNLLLQLLLVWRLGIKYRPSLDLKHPGVMRVGQLMLPVILSLSLPQVDVQINRIFGSYLGPGAIAWLNNANRLMQAPLGVFAQSSAIVLLPVLSEYAARKDFSAFRYQLSRGVRSILAMTLPASAIFIVLAEPIVKVAFERGRFGPYDTHQTALALIWYSVGIFAWASQAVIARAFYALHETWVVFRVGTWMTGVFILLNLLFMRIMGHAGLALSTSLSATLHMLILLKILQSRIDGVDGKRILSCFLRSLLASLVAGGVSWAMMRGWFLLWPATRTLVVALQVLVASALGFGAYFLTGEILRMEEAREVREIFFGRIMKILSRHPKKCKALDRP